MNEWDYIARSNLNEILANLYPNETGSRMIARDSGLNSAQIDFEGSSLDRWFNIIEHANNSRGKLDALVARALEQYPEDDALKSARNRAPPPLLKGPETISWAGPSGASQLEKIIGERSTLVPISYLETGLLRSRSVVRVKRSDGSSGTGFVTLDSVLITNHHVLPDNEAAKLSVIEFNYQQTAEGLNAPVKEARLLPSTFFKTSARDDWSAIKIEGLPSREWGEIPLTKRPINVGDHVNIIQHPGGGPKQISMEANTIVFVGGGRIQYLTDTLPGSSGSPVFDSKWNVVALHHSGGWLMEPNTNSKTTYYRNEGILIDQIIDGLSSIL